MDKYNGTILITIDGVRKKEIFNSNIAPFLNYASKKKYSKKIDNMVVANKYKVSSPGYNDIITGKVNEKYIDNHIDYNKNTNFFENYKLKPTLALAWEKFNKIYNTRRNKFKILNYINKTKKINNKIKKTKCSKIKFNKHYCNYNEECYAFQTFCYYWKKNNEKIKCGHLGFKCSDSVAHQNNFQEYTKYISFYDKIIKYIWKNLLPETIIITTDHGRGTKNWNDHYYNIPGSNNIWCIILSRNKNKLYNVSNVLSKQPINTDIYNLLHHFIIY